MTLELVHTEDAAQPGGHYSQAVRAGGMLWISGILPSPLNGPHHVGAFEDQLAQVFSHLEAILKAGGVARSDVVQMRVYVTDIAQWPAYDAAHARYFGAHRPARAVVPVSQLHHGYALEVEAVALAQ